MDAHDEDQRKQFAERIRAKERRKKRARQTRGKGMLFGMGMFGLVGWSVAIPTVLMVALGIWIDTHYPSPYSWTLMLLVVGIAMGCLNAWFWVREESQRG